VETNIGDRIRNRRRYLKMSMDELGSAIGFETSSRKVAVYQIETGNNRLRIDRLQSVATALKTSIYYLLGIIDDDNLTDDDIVSMINNIKEE